MKAEEKRQRLMEDKHTNNFKIRKKRGKTEIEMKGRKTTLKADQGANVLQLQRVIKVNRNRENGKRRKTGKCCNKGRDE